MCTCSESYTHTPTHTRTHTRTHTYTHKDSHTTSGGFTSWVIILWLVLNNHFSRGFLWSTSAISSNLAFIKPIISHSRIWYWFLGVLFCRAPVYWYVPFLFWHLGLFLSICVCVYVRICICVYTYVYIFIYDYIYIHIVVSLCLSLVWCLSLSRVEPVKYVCLFYVAILQNV